MSELKILLTDGLEEEGQSILKKSAEVINQPTISADELLKSVSSYDALIVRGRTKVTAPVFSAGSRLKVVGRAGVGVDNIDLNAARERHVTVVNAPLSTTQAVAELTVGLMLSLAREIPRADAGMKTGKWLKKEMEGAEVHGKTMGIVGVGRIGCSVSRLAAALGMQVLGFDPKVSAADLLQRGTQPVSLDDLFARSDWISIHVPLTNETRGMINAAAFARMKAGVRIICTARGAVIDEEALLAALQSGHVAGAALDVFTTEPPGQTSLVSHPHVVATPHVGAQTVEAQKRAAVDIANEVLAALRGDSLRWKVA